MQAKSATTRSVRRDFVQPIAHRVVGAGGSLMGYAGGVQTKIKLLELEGVNMAGMVVPKKGTAL